MTCDRNTERRRGEGSAQATFSSRRSIVSLGGLASTERDEAGLGRTVRGLKVTADELPDYVERVVRRFAADRSPGETFSTWAHRTEEDDLR